MILLYKTTCLINDETVNNHNCFCLICPISVANIKQNWRLRGLKWVISLLIDQQRMIWYAMITFNEFNCCSELLLFTSNQVSIVAWQCGQPGVLQGSQVDCFTQLRVPNPEEIDILVTTSCVVCGTGSGETRWGTNQVIKLAGICPDGSGTRNKIWHGIL